MNPFDQWLPTYQPGAVADRPWWRCVDGHQVRVDGVTRGGNFGEPHGAYAREFLGPWFATRDEWIAHLDAFDDAHPLPVPPVLPTQVYAGTADGYLSILSVSADGFAIVAGEGMMGPVMLRVPFAWFADRPLVAGPFAPWVPKGWRP